jgi:protein-tyrosine phosphatase
MIRSVLKAAFPRHIVQLLRDLGRLEPGAHGTYLRLAWQRRLGSTLRHSITAARTRMLVTVCHGNILRSAYAEALLKQPEVAVRVPGLRVSSAGLHTVAGTPADPRGVEVAREHGLDLTRHRSTLLDAQLVANADLLLVMDHVNAAEVVSRHPDAADKVVLLGSFDPARRDDAVIPDPYSGDLRMVRASYSRVFAAVAGLVESLSSR